VNSSLSSCITANDPLCGSAIDISFISPNNSNRLLAYRLGQGYEWVAYKVVEAKYGYEWLNKFIVPNLPNRDPQLTYDSAPRTNGEKDIKTDIDNEFRRQSMVANACELRYFLSFNNLQAYLSAKEIYEMRRPYSPVPYPLIVYHFPYNDQ
jgi:hypothetical protein